MQFVYKTLDANFAGVDYTKPAGLNFICAVRNNGIIITGRRDRLTSLGPHTPRQQLLQQWLKLLLVTSSRHVTNGAVFTHDATWHAPRMMTRRGVHPTGESTTVGHTLRSQALYDNIKCQQVTRACKIYSSHNADEMSTSVCVYIYTPQRCQNANSVHCHWFQCLIKTRKWKLNDHLTSGSKVKPL